MKRYSVAEARTKFSALLDAAEAGESVVIERRNVRFRLAANRPRKQVATASSPIMHADRAVLEGNWTWDWGVKGLRFSGRRQPKR